MATPPEPTRADGPGRARIRLGGAMHFGSDPTVVLLYAITFLLVGIGLIMVLSSSSITSYVAEQGFFGGFWRQATYAIIGLPLMLIAAAMPVTFWKKWAWAFLGLGIALQLLVFTPLGVEVYGNRNWIQIGSFGGQPSEALKLALVVWIGAVLLAKEPLLGQMRHELIPVILPGAVIVLGLVLLGRDLGTTLIMGATVFGAMYFAGISWRSLGVIAGGAILATFFFVVTSQNRLDRLFGHASGNEDYSGLGWQPLHGLWALAGGGVFGVGLGGSKAKWSWLPAADNDYIFAIIGEELGLIGAMLVIVIFVVLAAVMLRVIAGARDRFGKAVVGGILVWIVGQAFVNIGVVIGVLPVLGVPLPLISAGGTALIACLLAMGVVISIARDGAAHRAELAAAHDRAGAERTR
ncbi:cell division protein FtsW [Leucobacter sp. CSA1]|uniref:Probable peptidoglycan glycosyltransferase FtsW n=1 Tax=Leucobacter chromiisoli TaxID=2796471 RepID=A0A934UU84_9MICO|nr:putative peptidoglycan glycosyltransferase FtsW [Leucobacter chromiisoli]MBK0419209.1 cell division protein FtsW [Leucobacter chromiisoli]